MRIVRLMTDDGQILLGDDRQDGTATVLIDGQGVLGPREEEKAAREMLRGRQALVADDDEGIRRVVTRTLERFDCECTTCSDGAEAIGALDAKDFDFVVSDIVMPHHNGYEIFAASRAQRESRPVVLITGFGYDPGHAVVKASREGVEGVLYKPFTPRQLIEKVAGAIRSRLNGQAPIMVPSAHRINMGRMLAPVSRGDVLCVGRNYRAGDDDTSPPGDLELFMKPRSAVIDPGRPIRLPHVDEQDPLVDAEGELAVVFGSEARDVDEAEAMECVLGFTIANDVTATRWRLGDNPMAWMRGKGFETFCPIGPAIVTSDELDLAAGLKLTTSVNGTLVREGNTRHMMRSVPRLIAEISRHVALPAGTVLLTGAPPPRPGSAFEPLKPGDEVAVEIEGIGKLSNPVAMT
jgi:2-keto-4-pentenoate hydratase/2-oxohepta-3-ene-1,7-dioic acid hydratase in catechol pathway